MSEYNGWKNYETWNIKLWIDNEEWSYRRWRATAQACYNQAEGPSVNAKLTGREPFTRDERATLLLSGMLKDSFEENAPEVTGVWADLLNAALSEVDWHEIAEAMISEVDKEEEATA